MEKHFVINHLFLQKMNKSDLCMLHTHTIYTVNVEAQVKKRYHNMFSRQRVRLL